MYALKLTFQLHGPDDETIHEGMVGVTAQYGAKLRRHDLLDLLAAQMRKVLDDAVLDQDRVVKSG